MWKEIKTLFWLQWKLTRSMFRARRSGDRLRLLGLIGRVLSLLFAFPMFILMGLGLAVGLILLSPAAAYEVAVIVNTFLFFMWLMLPASYSSQLVERFEMSRLFPHPISFRGIVVGSTLMSMLTMSGLWTIPIILGEVVGLAWHAPLALPLILLGAVPLFAVLVLSGRIVDDFFDLVAGDRRLRALVLALLSLPFMVCWLGQYAVQFVSDDFSRLSPVADLPFLEGLRQLEHASGPSEALEILRVSRLLTWLPPGWATAGMGLVASGGWGRALLFFGLSVGSLAVFLWAHAAITRLLMQGVTLSIGTQRVRTRKGLLRLPGPMGFSALFRKDWLYLRRSPVPRRLIFSSLVMALSMLFPLRGVAGSDNPVVRESLPLIGAAFAVTMVSMIVNLSMTANYFGTVDREGFAAVALSPLDRRFVLISGNLSVLLYAGLHYLVLSLAIALVTKHWVVLPLGLFLGLCLQVGGAPAYNLAAIIGPYRAQLKFTRGRQRGNMWGLLAWLVSAPPVLALIVLPYVFWKPGLIVTLPLGVVYSLGLYTLTLKPLAQLLQRREFSILQAVVVEG